MHFDITTAIGILGGVFYLASHYMKAMVPLRVLALVSSVIYCVGQRRTDWGRSLCDRRGYGQRHAS